MFFPLAFTYFAFVVWFFRPFSCDLYFSLWHPLFVFEFLSVYLILISFICVQISVHLSSPSSACFFSFLVLCFISSPLLRFVFSKTFYVSSVSFVLTHKNTDPFLLKGCEWNVDMPIGSENGYLPQWESLFHFPSTDGFLAFGTDPCTDRGQSTCCCDFQRFVHCTNVSVSSVTQRCLLFWPLWTLQGSMDIICVKLNSLNLSTQGSQKMNFSEKIVFCIFFSWNLKFCCPGYFITIDKHYPSIISRLSNSR